MSQPRTVLHADASYVHPTPVTGITGVNRPYAVIRVTEGEPGYVLTGHVSNDLDYLRDFAATINAENGHTPDDVRAVRLSSMALSR